MDALSVDVEAGAMYLGWVESVEVTAIACRPAIEILSILILKTVSKQYWKHTFAIIS